MRGVGIGLLLALAGCSGGAPGSAGGVSKAGAPDTADTGDTAVEDTADTADTAEEDVCQRARRDPVVLDAVQVYGDHKVSFCHRTSPGSWILIEPSVQGCRGHQREHATDLFPTTGCEG